jgi:hypothetical protein
VVEWTGTIHIENPTKCNNVSKLYFIFIWSSAFFGWHTAHHQDPRTEVAASGSAYVVRCCTCSCWTLSKYVLELSGSLYSWNWKVFVYSKYDCSCHVTFLDNSHHSFTNNFQQLSLRNMSYCLANDQLTVIFSPWGDFNRRPLTEFSTGYVTNPFRSCSSKQIKYVDTTWHSSTSLWLINETVLELLHWEITENCCEGPHT